MPRRLARAWEALTGESTGSPIELRNHIITDIEIQNVRHCDHRLSWSHSDSLFTVTVSCRLGRSYQNLSYEAAVTHLHLVCFAYALLTHIAIDGESAKRTYKNAVRPSTADLQNELRRIIWDDLADHLKQFPSGTQIIKELKRLLIAAKKAA